MKTWTKVAIPIAAVAALAAWYAFRPERLVVNRQVDEAMPNAQRGLSAQPLESGRFYSILHPTEGTATIYQMGDGSRLLRLTSFSTSNAYKNASGEPLRPNTARMRSKSDTPFGPQITPSPSRITERIGSARRVATIVGSWALHSRPVRENTRTRSSSRWQMKRKPSCLIS